MLNGLIPDTPTEMTVTWSTIDETPNPFVQYGKFRPFESKVYGCSNKFVDPAGPLRLAQYIHRVTLTNLTQGETYGE